MDSEEKYREYSKKINDIIEKYKTRLDELNKLRKEMFSKGMNYDSEEIQKSLIETRQIYIEQEKMFYDLLHDVTNYLNSKNNEKNEILQKLKFLRNEIQFNYYQCFAERTKIENQTNFYNVGKIDKAIKEQYSKLENLVEKQKEYDKKILELMGIFLSIFSVVGISASSILNLQNNHISVLLMINGFVLITMTGLFYLIKFEKEKFIISKNWGFLIPLMIGLIMIVFGGIINIPSEAGKEKEIELLKKQIEKLDDKIELEKRLNLESKIINLENKTK